MVLVIDNYDSFVYNLARYVTELGFGPHVVRNDAITIAGIRTLAPTHIILSPGPRTPNEAGECMNIVTQLGPRIPILGVCLGHQAIAQAFGGVISRAQKPMHGKQDRATHHGKSIFSGITNPLNIGRYHSLIVSHDNFPACLKQTAHTKENEIMALEHKDYPVFGVQFHPESVLADAGHALLENFLSIKL